MTNLDSLVVLNTAQAEQIARFRKALDSIRAVTCGPDNEVQIVGSDEDRAIIQDALSLLDSTAQPQILIELKIVREVLYRLVAHRICPNWDTKKALDRLDAFLKEFE